MQMYSPPIIFQQWYIYQMNLKTLRFLAYVGIILTFVLSIWYTIRTYNEGNVQWIYLVLAFGIAILLSQNLIRPGKQKD